MHATGIFVLTPMYKSDRNMYTRQNTKMQIRSQYNIGFFYFVTDLTWNTELASTRSKLLLLSLLLTVIIQTTYVRRRNVFVALNITAIPRTGFLCYVLFFCCINLSPQPVT